MACRMHLVGPGKKPRKAEPMPFWNDHFVFPGQITLKLPRGKIYLSVAARAGILHRHAATSTSSTSPRTRSGSRCSAASTWPPKAGTPATCTCAAPVQRREAADVGRRPARRPVRHLVERSKSEWGQRKPPSASRWTCFDNNRCYSVMAGGFNRAGHRAALLQPAGPARPAAGQRRISAGNAVPAEKARENGRRLGRSDRALLLGPADAGRPGPGRFDRGPQQPLLPAIGRRGRRRRQAAATGSSIKGPCGNARWSQDIYFKLWTAGCGFRPAPGSGSGVAPNPVGYNRVYVHLDGEFSWPGVVEEPPRRARAFVTNGPLLRPNVEGQAARRRHSRPSRARNSNWRSA